MQPRTWRSWVGCTLAALLLGTSLPAAASETLDREAIEAIVREYLLREPQVVIDAIEAFRAQQEEARRTASREALTTQAAALTAAHHPSEGPADAAVTVVEFFDYRCSFCRRMAPAVESLMGANPEVRRVFIEFPVLGPESLRAAQAALAVWAQSPEAYPRYHHALMRSEDLSAPALVRMAVQLGLDGDQLLADMQSDDVRGRLQANYELASAIGVEGTPAYVIGDRLLPGAVPVQQLQAAVDAARPE